MGGKRKRSEKKDEEPPDPEKFCKTCRNSGRALNDTPFHQRCSSSLCPDRKKSLKSALKDVFKANQKELAVDDFPGPEPDGQEKVFSRTCDVTVKCGLATLLRSTPCKEHILRTMQSHVIRMTLITYEATRLANLYVTHLLEIGQAIPQLTYNAFMRLPFQAVTKSRDGSPKRTSNALLNYVRDNLYLPERLAAELVEWNDDKYLGQCISLAARVYAGNCQNHVTTNLLKRLRKWWDHELRIRLDFLNAGHRKGIFAAFVDGLDHPPAFRSLSGTQRELLLPVYQFLRERCNQDIMEGMTLSEDEVTSRWWKYLKPLWNLLRYTELTGEMPRPARLRAFTMLPLSTAQARYVHYDTDAFRELLLAAGICGLPRSKEDFRDQCPPNYTLLPPPQEYESPDGPNTRVCEHWWRWMFKLDKVTTTNRCFGYYVATDGMGISVSVLRRRQPEEMYLEGGINVSTQTTDYGFRLDENGRQCYVPLNILPTDRVVGVDPGRKDPFVGVYGPDRRDKISCSRKEYYQLAGFTENARMRRKWMKGNAEIERINSQMPSARVSSSQAFRSYLQFALRNMTMMIQFFNAVRWKRLRWKAYIAKEKAWDTLVKRITFNDPRTIVALGDGKFAHNSRGHPTTPTKQLRKRLRGKCRLRMVDEWRTSIECSLCRHSLPKKTRIWQVKVCPDCLTNWNRDVNGARNIRAIFLHMNDNDGAKPSRFCRPVATDTTDERQQDGEGNTSLGPGTGRA
jgi:transposase